MKGKSFILFVISILVVGCSEFSETEEHVIKYGRLLNEAVSAEYHDFSVRYWDQNIYTDIQEYAEEFEDQSLEDIAGFYSVWGDGFLSDAYADEQEKKAKTIEYVLKRFDKMYDQINDLIKTRIETKGVGTTADELNTVMHMIESKDQEWYYNEDEHSFEAKLGLIIAHPKYGFRPNISEDYPLENITWRYCLSNDIQEGGTDNCAYATLKVMQQWLNDKKEEHISVVYCVPYGDSLNSYLVGYSNQRSFMITFLRNDEENCRYEWQQMEYESTYVGNNLLD